MAARRQGSVRRQHGSACAKRSGASRCTCGAGWSYRTTVAGRRLERGGFPTKQDAERALRAELERTARGTRQADEKWRTPFAVYAAEWLESRRLEVRESTWSNYVPAVKGAVAYFGTAPIGRIGSDHVRAFREQVAATRKPKTTANWLGVLKALFNRAVADGLLPASPAAEVRPPMQDHSERPWPTREEVEDIAAAAEAPWDLAIRLIAETGLRRGELIGLRWGDLDLERRRLRVARSMGPHGESAPKTRAGARSIPLRRSMGDALVAHRLAATGSDDRDPVFSHPGGGHQSPHALHRSWCRARRRAGAREELCLHSLRHYAASCFIRAGASVKTVQTAMGHSSATLTLDLYAHLFDADLDVLADRLEAQDAQFVGTAVGASQFVALGDRSPGRS